MALIVVEAEAVNRVIEILETAQRQGAVSDEPEGARFITISDTLAKEIVAGLEPCR